MTAITDHKLAPHARIAQYTLAELNSCPELATAVRTEAASIRKAAQRGGYDFTLRGDTKVVATAISILMAHGKLAYAPRCNFYMSNWSA